MKAPAGQLAVATKAGRVKAMRNADKKMARPETEKTKDRVSCSVQEKRTESNILSSLAIDCVFFFLDADRLSVQSIC